MLMIRYPFSGVGAEGASASPKIFVKNSVKFLKIRAHKFRHLCFLLSDQWVWLNKRIWKTDWLFSPIKQIFWPPKKTSYFPIRESWWLPTTCCRKFVGENLPHKSFWASLGKFGKNIPRITHKFASSCTYMSIDGFSDYSNDSVRLAEHEKSSCHLQAGIQWFEANQRLRKGCSLDSINHIYHLPLHQTFIVLGYLRV